MVSPASAARSGLKLAGSQVAVSPPPNLIASGFSIFPPPARLVDPSPTSGAPFGNGVTPVGVFLQPTPAPAMSNMASAAFANVVSFVFIIALFPSDPPIQQDYLGGVNCTNSPRRFWLQAASSWPWATGL